MAIAMEAFSYNLLDTTGFDLLSEFRFGGNGSYWGAPELDAGDIWDEPITGRTTWDSNLSDGLDSMWVPVSLIVRTGDSTMMRWSVNYKTMTYLGPGYNNLTEMQIRTAVSGQASLAWTSLRASFFHEGTLVDQWLQDNGPSVNLTSSGPASLESIVTLLPNTSNVDEIRFSAMVRMTAPAGVPLDPNSIFGQVLIKDDVA